MIERITNDHLVWLDVINPTPEEIRELLEELDIKPHLVSDLTTPIRRPRVQVTEKTLKLTLHYPIVKRTDIKQSHEIKLLATKTHLLTVRFEDIEAIHRFKKEFEVLSALRSTDQNTASGAHILLSLLTHLFDGLHKKLDYIDTKINEIDDAIHDEREKEMVREISRVNRRLIAFRHTIQTYEHILSEMHTTITTPFDSSHVAAVKELSRNYHHLIRRVRGISDTLDELRDTNIGILTTKQNEVMKILTIMAFITFPLTLFTSMFGMNTHTTPLVGRPGDFWLIVGIMVIVSIGFFGYFKYKKWM